MYFREYIFNWYLLIPNFLTVFRMLETVIMVSFGVIKLTALSDVRRPIPSSSLPAALPDTLQVHKHTQADRFLQYHHGHSVCLAHLPRSCLLTCFTVPDSPAGPAQCSLADLSLVNSTFSSPLQHMDLLLTNYPGPKLRVPYLPWSPV